jgi:hypothetical protein
MGWKKSPNHGMPKTYNWTFMSYGSNETPKKIPWYFINYQDWGFGFSVVFNRAFRGIKIHFLCFESVLGWYYK